MSAFEGSAALSLDQHHAAATAPAEHERPWQPAATAESPAIELQRKLQASLGTDNPFPEISVPPAEQALRAFSRAAGWATLAGAVALTGWLIV